MSNDAPKILIIRFSSLGDVLQTLSVIDALHNRWPQSHIHWVTRSEFVPLIEHHPHLTKAWGLDKKNGFSGLLKLGKELNAESFDRIYDAHRSLRSQFLCFYLLTKSFFQTPFKIPQILRRSLKRWKRFLLFRFRINYFEQPFSGQRDLLEPLKKWDIPSNSPPAPQLFLPPNITLALETRFSILQDPFVALAPSAAFELKRWPLAHWKSLLELWLAADNNINFILLGGPEDQFLESLQQINPQRIINLAGRLSLSESAEVIKHSKLLIANDTGLLHAGEQLGRPCIALMGPAPFGFPSRKDKTKIMELQLDCRPCSKHGQGPCRNPHHQWCLVGITPEAVLKEAKTIWAQQYPDHPQRHPL